MWAQVLVAPRTFELREVPPPDPGSLGEGEVLVELVAGATCASDLPFFRGLFRSPHEGFAIPGRPLHEIVARIVDPGDSQFSAGERVAGWASRFDGLQERFVTRADGLVRVPDDLDDADATVVQALAVVLALADRVPSFAGKRVAVIGLGAYGNLLAHVAGERGAAEVVGIDRLDRADDAKGFGLDKVVHATSTDWARGLDDHERPDIVIEAAGHQTASYVDALAAVAPRGGVYLFGAPDDAWAALPLAAIWLKQVTIGGGPASDKREYLERGAEHLAEHPWLTNALITARLPYRSAQEAFESAAAPAAGRLKTLVTV